MKLEIITRESLCKEVADRFKKQYRNNNGVWSTYNNKDIWPLQPEQVHTALVDANGNVDAIKKILPNGGWTQEMCGQCEEYKPVTAALNRDYDSGATLCLDCARKVVVELEQATK